MIATPFFFLAVTKCKVQNKRHKIWYFYDRLEGEQRIEEKQKVGVRESERES